MNTDLGSRDTVAVDSVLTHASRVAGVIGDQIALVIPDPDDIRVRGPILVPLAFILLVNTVTAIAMQPAMTAALGPAGPAVARTGEFWMWLAALFSPALVLLKALILAAVAWAIVVLIGGAAPFRALLSVNVYGQGILALSALLSSVVIHVRGLETVTSPDALLVAQGIDLFLDVQASPILLALAQQTTIFHIAWFGFTVWCLPRVAPLSRATSLGITSLLWAGGLITAWLRSTLLV